MNFSPNLLKSSEISKEKLSGEIFKVKETVSKILGINSGEDLLNSSKHILEENFQKLFTNARILNGKYETKFLSNQVVQTDYFYNEKLANLDKGEVISIKYGGDEFVFFYRDKVGNLKMLFVDVANMGPVNNVLGEVAYIGNTPSGSNIVDVFINKLQNEAQNYLGNDDLDGFAYKIKEIGYKLTNLSESEFNNFKEDYNINCDFETYQKHSKKSYVFAKRRQVHRVYDKNFLDNYQNVNHNSDKIKNDYKNYLINNFFENNLEKNLNFFKDKNSEIYKCFLQTDYFDERFLLDLESFSDLNIDKQISIIHDLIFLKTSIGEEKLLNIDVSLLDISGGVSIFTGKNHNDFLEKLGTLEVLQMKSKKNNEILKSENYLLDNRVNEIENLIHDDKASYSDILEFYSELEIIKKSLNKILELEDINIYRKINEKINKIMEKINQIKYSHARTPDFKTGDYLRDFRINELLSVKNFCNYTEVQNFKISCITLEQENTGSLNSFSYDLVDFIPTFLLKALQENQFFNDKIEYITLVKDGGGKIRIIAPTEIIGNSEFKNVLKEFNKKIIEKIQEEIKGNNFASLTLDSVGRNGTKNKFDSIGVGKYQVASTKTLDIEEMIKGKMSIYGNLVL